MAAERGCLVCLDPIGGEQEYHQKCLRRLFGTSRPPTVAIDSKHLPELIARQAERISISGVQDKLVMDLSVDRSSLVVVESGGRYILKPQIRSYHHLPENEHLTMSLARLAGIEVPEFGLVRLADGTPAYVVKRFDRTDDDPPRKLRQEDFCSLTGRLPADKYWHAAEECIDVVTRATADPAPSLRRLLRQLVFAWWTGNADLHLKNLSLREGPSGAYELSPAYDLVCTRIYPQHDPRLALSINGKDLGLRRPDFLAFAARCDLADEAPAIIDSLIALHPRAAAMIERSALPKASQVPYRHWLEKHGKALSKQTS